MTWPARSGGPRIRITGGNTISSVKTAVVSPPWIEYANKQWYRQSGTINPDGSITWGAGQAIAGANNSTYTLTAADVPTVSGTAVRVFMMVDGPSVTSDYSVIRAS